MTDKNLKGILKSLQSMKDSQKKKIRRESDKMREMKHSKDKTIHKKKHSTKEPKVKNGEMAGDLIMDSKQWIDKLDRFNHLNGCNININNNYININTLNHREKARNIEIYGDLQGGCDRSPCSQEPLLSSKQSTSQFYTNPI